jgi:hypothetical protein
MKSTYAANIYIYIYIAGYKSIKIGIKFVSFDPLMHVGCLKLEKHFGKQGFHFMSFFSLENHHYHIFYSFNSLMCARFFM